MSSLPGGVDLWELARLSEIAYLDFEEGQSLAKSIGFQTVKFFDVAPSQAWLWRRGNEVAVMAYRGTEVSRFRWRDLVSNARVGPNPWNGVGRAHAGYARQFHAMMSESRMMLEEIQSSVPLILTGHSMGGAIATVTAAWVPSLTWQIAGLVTFGAPKALNKTAASNIKTRVIRVANKYDFAPSWPPLPPYRHPSKRLSVNSGGWPGPITRHGTDKYVKATRELVL